MKNTLRIALAFVCGLALLATTGCFAADPNAASSDQNGTTNTDQGTDQRNVTFKMLADFSTSTAGGDNQSGAPTRSESCPSPAPEQDGPDIAAGLDCDGDGAPARYITPSVFKVAVKRFVVIDTNGSAVEILPTAAKLIDSKVVDLTSPVTLTQTTLPEGKFVRMEAEFYYYELVMPLNDPPVSQGIRVYLSDDDFPAEGQLGHHQGDITLIDSTGKELGFAPPGGMWTPATVLAQRQDTEGAGGPDPETGHSRGLYGDAENWNRPAFMQGPTKDVFIFTQDINLDLTPAALALVAAAKTVTVVFNVADSWFYEDYDNDGKFTPCGNGLGVPGDACYEGGAWSPIFPTPQVQIE